jgi:hypothetical protein
MDASEAFLTSNDIKFTRNEATKSVVQDGDTTEETAEKKVTKPIVFCPFPCQSLGPYVTYVCI